jgi:hypothetical protein
LEGYEIVTNYYDGLVVPEGVTLTLESGVTLMFEGEFDTLAINGRLRALGTITQPVTIMASPQNSAGKWTAVYAYGGAVDLAHTTIMSAEVGVYISSLEPGANVHIADSTFRGNVRGVFVEMVDPSANVVIKNNLFTDNTFYPLGIVATHLHQVQIINSTFLNNTPNRILIDTYKDNDSLIGNAILLPHVGLEGYEVNEFPTANSLIISDGITLTLEANVVMMLAEDAAMQVNGRLHTLGTPTQPVTITSAANTGAGEWDGLIFEGGEGDLQYTTVRYGKTNIEVVSDTAVVTLTHTQVVSGLTGLRVEKGVVTAVCATFSQNQNDGIHIFNGGNPAVNIFSSNISGNGGAGLNNESGVLVNARYNWWGDASGPGGLGSGSGDAVWGHVSYEPWLLEPDCLPPPVEQFYIYLPIIWQSTEQ